MTSHRLFRRVGSAGRLAVFNTIILALILGAVVAVFIRNFTSSYQAVAASSIGVELRVFQQEALKQKPSDLVVFSKNFLVNYSLAPGEVVIISFVNSNLLSTPGSAPVLQNSLVRQWMSTPPSQTVVLSTTIGAKSTEIVAAPIFAGRQIVGTFIATSDLSSFTTERAREIRLSIAEGLLALLAGVLSTFLLLRRLLRKVGRITTTADEIGSGNLDQRLGDQGSNDEVGELAQTFDAMLDRVQAVMIAQRRLLSDVSHQLRTPLTAARGHLEVLGRGSVDNADEVRETIDVVIDQLDHTRSVVERLLMLGRAMEPDFLDTRPTELRRLLDEVHTAVRVLAKRNFVEPQAPDLVIEVDVEKVRGALMNLVDNAVRATREDDTIALVAEADYEDEVLRLSVEDSGPGIPQSEREAVIERFKRPGARDRDGSGLGLAIVKAVAEAHGGWIDIETSRYGGAQVTMVLPITRFNFESEV
ncbi:MAG: HAMP domain-containing histidine kinase [Acidimicrobiaceae bacterium]|nr:HAMP domain-containing histidine kinase [Acidimicrobiaceae bacterium]